MTMSKGEFRVGIDFNPSGNTEVSDLKIASATLIDIIEAIDSDRKTDVGNERGRLKALAQTHIETAAMYAVKAATKREPEGGMS